MYSPVLLVMAATTLGHCTGYSSACDQGLSLPFVSRAEWGARTPKLRQNMKTPVDSVIMHHTYMPGACHGMDQCAGAMRSMQRFHMDDRGWDDIGYSFAIGDEWVFEGRGWHNVGAHAPGYNNHSIGIAFIGDYRVELPTPTMLGLAHQLIRYGVDSGYIQPEYQLLGHRQVRSTECPGDALYQEIQTWSAWRKQPLQET